MKALVALTCVVVIAGTGFLVVHLVSTQGRADHRESCRDRWRQETPVVPQGCEDVISLHERTKGMQDYLYRRS